MNVLGVCQSDRIYGFIDPLELYAQENDGRLPAPSDLLDLMPEGYPMPRCSKGEKPFAINRRLPEINIHNDNDRLPIWCPVGSHDGFVATLFLRDGKIVAEVTSLEELASALEQEIRHEYDSDND